jgi:two-component sensor histidine kinase/ligand-binding sensor domain-containing protein
MIKFDIKLISKCLAILFCISSGLSAQQDEIQFSHLTAEDGLSLSAVTKILQDDNGFLWFGTYNGLNRYDGYNFKIFLPDVKSPKSISNHSVWSLLKDSKGFIWVGTLDGLNRYDWKTDQFKIYKNNPKDANSISDNSITSSLIDKSGDLWIGTTNGINKYNRDKDNFTVIKKVTNRLNGSFNAVICMAEDNNGNLWLGTWNGLTCMHKDGKIIKQLFSEENDYKITDYRKISSLFEDDENNLWIGVNGKGLKKYNHLTGKIVSYISVPGNPNTLSNNTITTVFKDKFGNLWVGTKEGLNKYNYNKDNFTRILHDPQKPLSIINNEILSIYQDNSGLIWIGSIGGVSRFNQSINKFNYYEQSDKITDSNILSNRVHSVLIDKEDNIWVATFKGLDEIINGKNTIVHYRNEPGNNNSLAENFIRCVSRDNEGNIWAGTDNSGLNIYDPKSKRYKSLKYFTGDTNSISNNGVISICEDHNGIMWVGTWWGLNRYNKITGKFDRLYNNPANPNSLCYNLVWAIKEDSKGMLWFGTDGGGASEFDPKTNKFITFSKDSNNVNRISENRVFVIFESHDGVIWLGTSDGLNAYDRSTGKITIYKKINGLPENSIASIQEDNKGCLWIATDEGFSKLDRKTGQFTNYTKRNGLKELEFVHNASAKSKDGTLYFACKKGLMYFNPDSIKDETLEAPVVLTDLKIFNQSLPITDDGLLRESINSIKSIALPSGNEVITLEFALLDYYDVKKNTFKYKLAGFDPDWNDVGTRNNATYTNLPPGEYIFRVKASNSNGVRNEKETAIKIIIIPKYYQTWWFKIIFVLGLIITTLVIIHDRTRKIKKHNKILENRVADRTKDLDIKINELNQEIVERKKVEEKVQASLNEKEVLLKEIHHRVKNNLQIISSLLYLQSKSITDKATLGLFVDSQNRIKSMALIHEKLYQSKDFARVNFNEYAKGLVDHLKKSYGKKDNSINCYVNIDKEINLNLDTAICCGLIINELMTNIYKYAFPADWVSEKSGEEELKIEINSTKSEGKFYNLSVIDNGIGIAENLDVSNSTSLGLKIVKSMVDQLEGSIEISRNGGTHFIIKFSDLK